MLEAVPKPPQTGPKTPLDDTRAVPEHVWCPECCRTCSQNDFLLFLRRRADAPMCFPIQFQWCFVDIRRNERRLRVDAENARKSARFGFENRARERPGDPKSSSSEPVRAKKRARRAAGASEKLKDRSNEGFTRRKGASESHKELRNFSTWRASYENL